MITSASRTTGSRSNGTANKLSEDDKRFHNWYRFVLSFPPHLVREYVDKFGVDTNSVVLDPFCGTGTTIVEAKMLGFNSIGIEANPMAHFASSVKTDWDLNGVSLLNHAKRIADLVVDMIDKEQDRELRSLHQDTQSILLKDSISPLPLHKALVLLEGIKTQAMSPYYRHELLAFAKCLVFSFSNLHFGPEVGVSRAKKTDAPVVDSWLQEVKNMAMDLDSIDCRRAMSNVYHADSRSLKKMLQPRSIDAVFTSPPYPNEKDYTRTTRLESALLGFINNKSDLRALKKDMLRSNTRNVYKGDDDDDWIMGHSGIQAIAEEIEERRISMGKTSGFERLYSKVTKLYFGGMARHLSELRQYLKPGAYLGYVVGDQASYLRVMIKTGELLAEVSESLGYKVERIDLFRTRLSTATRQQLREEVLVLRWP